MRKTFSALNLAKGGVWWLILSRTKKIFCYMTNFFKNGKKLSEVYLIEAFKFTMKKLYYINQGRVNLYKLFKTKHSW